MRTIQPRSHHAAWHNATKPPAHAVRVSCSSHWHNHSATGAPGDVGHYRLASSAGAAVAAAILFSSSTPAALAIGPVSVKLEGLEAIRVDCGAGISSVGGVTFSGQSQKAACLDVRAAATNPSNKPLYNADVFGRIYDVNGEAAIDDTENIRIAYIDEIPPGKSTVTFKLNVPLEQYNLGPLSLQGFKATGFAGGMLPKTAGGGLLDSQSASDCEITGDCDDIAAAAAIR